MFAGKTTPRTFDDVRGLVNNLPAADEAAILQALHEIDELAAGQIEVTQYVAHQPRFSPFALIAVGLWSLALVCGLGVKQLRRFP